MSLKSTLRTPREPQFLLPKSGKPTERLKSVNRICEVSRFRVIAFLLSLIMAYAPARKAIVDPHGLQQFLESPTCSKYVQFLEDLNESVKGLPNDAPTTSNEVPAHCYKRGGGQDQRAAMGVNLNCGVQRHRPPLQSSKTFLSTRAFLRFLTLAYYEDKHLSFTCLIFLPCILSPHSFFAFAVLFLVFPFSEFPSSCVHFQSTFNRHGRRMLLSGGAQPHQMKCASQTQGNRR